MTPSDNGQPRPHPGDAGDRFAIELNDAMVTVCSTENVLLQSPGLALARGRRLLVGSQARAQARHYPRQVHSRFWGQLGMDPLVPPMALARTQADLAFAHLKAVRGHLPQSLKEVLLVVPGTLSHDQLGLLLGMAEALQLPVSGIVDTGVAASSRPFPEGALMHLSLQLHQTLLTSLRQDETAVDRARIEVLRGLGRLVLDDTLAKGIADRFVDRTRFDPLKLPDTEQALYDGLPRWLEALCQSEAVQIEMEAGGRSHRLRMDSGEAIETLGPHLERLALWIRGLVPQGTPVAIQLGSQFARVPGLEAVLSQHLEPCQIIPLGAAAPGQGALHHAQTIRSPADDRRLVTSLPWADPVPEAALEAPGPATPPARADPRPVPTHVLYRGLAYPLGEHPLAVGREPAVERGHIRLSGALAGISRLHCELSLRGHRAWVEDRSTYGVLLNGDRIGARAELRAGDLLDLGGPGQQLRLITVMGSDAPP